MTAREPSWLAGVSRPTLVLDPQRARRNIRRMAERMRKENVALRPHFKTHQSPEVGRWLADEGATGITVSSVDMARCFADHGWQDVTVAFPVNLRQVDDLTELAARITLGVVLDDPDVAERLSARLGDPVRVWLKVDAGYGRAGLAWQDPEGVTRCARRIAGQDHLSLAGLLAHAGHSYHATSRAQVQRIHDDTVHRLVGLRDHLSAQGLSGLALSIGDTPCCSLATGFEDIDEVRPGNYVFYDLMQARIGACRKGDVAVALACPVVGVYPAQRKVVLYGGAVHLSKEGLDDPEHGRLYGTLAAPTDDGWGPALTQSPVVSLSQEHAVVRVAGDAPLPWRPGDLALVLPVHACLTADLHPDYLTPDGARIPRCAKHP